MVESQGHIEGAHCEHQVTLYALSTCIWCRKTREFLEAYQAKFGEIPSSPWPLYAADAFKIIAYAIDKTGSTDGDILAEYLRNEVDGVPGVTGPIGFTKQGDREGVPFYLYVVNDQGQIVISE